MKRTEMENKVLAVFDGRDGLTEGDVKACFPEESDKRWVRSVLTKLCVKNDLRRVKRYNWCKHTAEWIYTLNNKKEEGG